MFSNVTPDDKLLWNNIKMKRGVFLKVLFSRKFSECAVSLFSRNVLTNHLAVTKEVIISNGQMSDLASAARLGRDRDMVPSVWSLAAEHSGREPTGSNSAHRCRTLGLRPGLHWSRTDSWHPPPGPPAPEHSKPAGPALREDRLR
ncbi:hypothetical protein CapIbe_019967 [Capra ibex]